MLKENNNGGKRLNLLVSPFYYGIIRDVEIVLN